MISVSVNKSDKEPEHSKTRGAAAGTPAGPGGPASVAVTELQGALFIFILYLFIITVCSVF